MEAGQIVVAALPQVDGKTKPRPALLLKRMPGRGHWLVCGISTQLYEYVKGFDVMMDQQHPDHAKSGLLETSVIRLGFLGLVPAEQIRGAIGAIGSETYHHLIKNLTDHLSS